MAQKKNPHNSNGGTARATRGAKHHNNGTITHARVRMYRHGLGDCILLSFGDAGLRNAAHILVDCGTLGATTTGVTMADVVQDIAETTGGHLSALVATHEHMDHVSGFNSQKDAFDNMTVDNSWVAWTEDPHDPLAKKISKYNQDLKGAALAGAEALERQGVSGSPAQSVATGLREVLSFFGEPAMGATFAKGVNEAMNYVRTRAPEENQAYLQPGTFLQPDWLPGVTVYVLGPPRDIAKIKNMGEHGSSELYELSSRTLSSFRVNAQWMTQNKDSAAYRQNLEVDEREQLELCMPFDARFRLGVIPDDPRLKAYNDPEESWRRIDSEWLQNSADFALQLDSLTNNTSLVLAFEIGEDGPVILTVGDAQLGNWLSWHDYTWKVPGSDGKTRTIQAKDLLERTVVYKVGHHSSHNATAVTKGLEMMTSKDLAALIPVDRKVATKKKWTMPAPKLYQRLLQKTSGRVLRSDIGWPDDDERPDNIPKSAWKKPGAGTEIPFDPEQIYVDVNISV